MATGRIQFIHCFHWLLAQIVPPHREAHQAQSQSQSENQMAVAASRSEHPISGRLRYFLGQGPGPDQLWWTWHDSDMTGLRSYGALLLAEELGCELDPLSSAFASLSGDEDPFAAVEVAWPAWLCILHNNNITHNISDSSNSNTVTEHIINYRNIII